jgi:glycosyltransferase involved in cell wall biosynthesis
LVVNSPSWETLAPIKWVEKIVGTFHRKTLIVADVPSVMEEMVTRKSLSSTIHNRLSKSTMVMSQGYDKYVFLADAMKEFYVKCSDPAKYIVVEGMINVDAVPEVDYSNQEGKEILLYAGSLKKIFGISNLVEAFCKIKRNDIELWLCGSGDYAETIEKISKEDKRIKFFGLVSGEEARALQQKATILINPRTSEGEYTKYSFPSKTIEYLLAGRTVIMNRLPGVPSEYYNYLYTPADESVDALAKEIELVLEEPKETRLAKCKQGREFIMKKKNSMFQGRRIVDFMLAE